MVCNCGKTFICPHDVKGINVEVLKYVACKGKEKWVKIKWKYKAGTGCWAVKIAVGQRGIAAGPAYIIMKLKMDK